MGELKDAQEDVQGIRRTIIDEIIKPLRERQDALTEQIKELYRIANQIDQTSQRLVMPVVEEIEGEGGPKERKRKSTNLDTPSAGVHLPKGMSKEVMATDIPPATYFKAEGKRGCGNCGKPGHRRTTCPEPDKKANVPMGKRACSKCGNPGHRAPTCKE